jgi:hypothetical protein
MEILMLIIGLVTGSVSGFAVAKKKYKTITSANAVKHLAGITAYGSKNKTKTL